MMENSDPCYCIGHGCGVIKALFRQSIPMLDAIGGIHHTWGPMKKPKNRILSARYESTAIYAIPSSKP